MTANLFKTLLGLWLLLCPCLSFGQERLNVVFDLDWTLLNSTTEAMVQADSKDTFAFEGKWYRIAHGTAESIIKLHQQGFEISIYSGGTADRNDFAAELIIKQIHALGVSDFKFKQVLDLSDLLVVSEDPNARFSDRYKKELSRFFDITRTLIVDDMMTFAVKGQEKNMVWLGKTYLDRPRFDLLSLEDPAGKSYSAPNLEEWIRDYNKIKIAVENIIKARDLMNQKQISLPEAFYYVDPFKTKFPMCGNLF